MLAGACGGDGGSSSTADPAETADTSETADPVLTADTMSMEYVELTAATNDAESAARALLLVEAIPGATPDDAARLDDAIVEALSASTTDFTSPLGQSVVARLPMLQGTAMVATTIGLPFKFQNMGSSGRSAESNAPGVNKVITVEGSRLTMELSVSLSESADGVTFTDEVTGKASADVCPDANGIVTIDIDITERVSQEGFAARMSLTARATATVGEDAEVQSFSVDTRSGFDAQQPDGTNGFIEYESTIVPGGKGWQRTSDRVSRDRRGARLTSAPQMREKVEDLAGFAAAVVLDGAKDR